MKNEVCTDNHSDGLHCPEHGYDNSVPAPSGYRWHEVERADGQLYIGMAPDETA